MLWFHIFGVSSDIMHDHKHLRFEVVIDKKQNDIYLFEGISYLVFAIIIMVLMKQGEFKPSVLERQIVSDKNLQCCLLTKDKRR